MRKFLFLLSVTLCTVASYAQDAELYGVPIDFSYAGYHYGEKPIPDYPTGIVLHAPEDGSDATLMIQQALDMASAGTAVLLKKGLYNISNQIFVRKDSIVLRGEGNSTVIKASGTKRRALIKLGKDSDIEEISSSEIIDRYVPTGQMWVNVQRPSAFKVGDRVTVNFHPNQAWISAIKMDQIYPRKGVVQWTPDKFKQYWERIVVKKEGKKIWLDAPLVLEMKKEYADQMYLAKISTDKVEESGVERLMVVSDYDPSVVDDKGNHVDENHATDGICVEYADHCWVKNVKSAHFVFSLISLNIGAKNITVQNCRSTAPVSIINGGRRYAFYISKGGLCLIKNCIAEHDRHGFVTGRTTPGPNVFQNCTMVNAYSHMGPHHRWATGLLYDCCSVDEILELHDRGDYGSGHGWAGANNVLWNCTANIIYCQSPWAHAKNWCIGCIGEKVDGRKHKDNLKRPDGEWFSHGTHVEPYSLYDYQHQARTK